ncbi:hypothetical protein [Clostridium perfringens]|uniref:hypothetical protein n=1 Tax=Clostridium perfringens TaxID=1502 RepID=UPI0024BD530F|nr:hypothetical protein [Clostridium perfringens]
MKKNKKIYLIFIFALISTLISLALLGMTYFKIKEREDVFNTLSKYNTMYSSTLNKHNELTKQLNNKSINNYVYVDENNKLITDLNKFNDNISQYKGLCPNNYVHIVEIEIQKIDLLKSLINGDINSDTFNTKAKDLNSNIASKFD